MNNNRSRISASHLVLYMYWHVRLSKPSSTNHSHNTFRIYHKSKISNTFYILKQQSIIKLYCKEHHQPQSTALNPTINQINLSVWHSEHADAITQPSPARRSQLSWLVFAAVMLQLVLLRLPRQWNPITLMDTPLITLLPVVQDGEDAIRGLGSQLFITGDMLLLGIRSVELCWSSRDLWLIVLELRYVIFLHLNLITF